MTKTKRFIALILGCTMCASLAFGAACGKKDDDDTDPDTTIDGTDGGDSSASAATTATITYDSNGGSSVSSSTVEIGKTVGTLPTPTRSGYNFLGWYYVNGTEEVEFTGIIPVACDMTLKAKWIEQSDFYLYYQNYLVIDTGEEWHFQMYASELDEDAYITITKSGTTKTVEEATSAGWIIDSLDYSYSSCIDYYLTFGQSGDYTITGYSYSQTCTTVVTAVGDTVTAASSTFTASTVSFDKIRYLSTEYASGSTITTYYVKQIYVYFNAPMASEVTITYTSVTDPTDTGVFATSYSGMFTSRYKDGQYYLYIYASRLAAGYTYTVKLESVSNGSAEASFTLAAPAAETKFITTPETSENISMYGSCYDYYYVLSTTAINNVGCSFTDSNGNEVDNSYYSANSSSYINGYNVYYITYDFYANGLTAGTYTLTITPYDSEGNTISALVKDVIITVTSSGSSSSAYWNVVSTDSQGNYNYYYDLFLEGEARTIQYTANAEFSKVAVCGVYINTTSATTITRYNGTTISAIYSVADGVTTVSITIKAADLEDLYILLMGSNADGSVQCSTWVNYNVLSAEAVEVYSGYVKAAKYSLETYFADQIAEGGALNSVYTKLQAFTTTNSINTYIEAVKLYEEVYSAVGNLTTDVYNSGTDYVSSLASALASKTSLCNTAIYYYVTEVYNFDDYILGDDTVTSNLDMFKLGMERYLIIETSSDKEICDWIYYLTFYYMDIDEFIEEYDGEFNGAISALVTAHDSGTVDEYIAAVNAYILTSVVADY